MKIIALNAPPGSGKDTFAKIVQSNFNEIKNFKFSKILKDEVHKKYNIRFDNGDLVPHDYFDKVKDIPSVYFYGISPREAYIYHAESFIKPKYGRFYFADKLCAEIKKEPSDSNIIISDLGFHEELDELIKCFGISSILLTRIYRNGCSFGYDSRSYVYSPFVKSVELENNDFEDYKRDVVELSKLFFDEGIVKNFGLFNSFV